MTLLGTRNDLHLWVLLPENECTKSDITQDALHSLKDCITKSREGICFSVTRKILSRQTRTCELPRPCRGVKLPLCKLD